MKIYLASLITLLIIMVTSVGYVLTVGDVETGTYTISAGPYPGAPSYTIWSNTTYYFSKNSFGETEFSDSNFSQVLHDSITGLPEITVTPAWASGETITAVSGSIYIKQGSFVQDTKTNVPLGSRLYIYGDGVTHQGFSRGVEGGTILNCTDATGSLNVGFTLLNGTTLTGSLAQSATEFNFENIEIQQTVDLTDNDTSCVLLNGMAQGGLDNVVVSTYAASGDVLTGRGITVAQTFGTEEETLFKRVEISGFDIALWCEVAHINVDNIQLENVRLGLKVVALPNQVWRQLHFFEAEQIIDVGNGTDATSFYGVFLEDCGPAVSPYYEWSANDDFNKTVKFYDVNVVNCDSEIWTFENPEKFYFENVVCRTGSPAFPTCYTPTLSTGVAFVNNQSQLIEVYVTGGTVSTIEVNGVTTGLTEGTFQLYSADTIEVTYTDATSWVWRGVSAVQRDT